MKVVLSKEGLFELNDELAMYLFFKLGISEIHRTDEDYIFKGSDGDWESFEYNSKEFRTNEVLVELVEKGLSETLEVIEVPYGVSFMIQISREGEKLLREDTKCH
jgi:hypothetical protein